MSYDILELQHELTEIQRERNEENQIEDSSHQIRVRTARRNVNIDMLLKRGSTPCEISEILQIPIDLVNTRVAKLERDEEEKREFFATGEMPSTGGYVAIFR